MWCCCNVPPEMVHKQIIYLSRIWNTQTTIELTQLDDQRRSPGGREAWCPFIILFFSEWSLIYISRGLFVQVPPVIGVQSPWLCVPTCNDILQQGSLLSQYLSNDRSLHVMESVFRNPWNFCLWNPESWAVESGIHLKESGILLRIGIQNPSSTDKDWNQEPQIRNQRREIQNPRLPWLALTWGLTAREAGSRHGTTTHKKLNFYSKPAQTIQGYRLYFLNPLSIDIKIEILIYCRYTFSIEVVGRICWNIN